MSSDNTTGRPSGRPLDCSVVMYAGPPEEGTVPWIAPLLPPTEDGTGPDPMDPDVMRKILKDEISRPTPMLWYLAHPVGEDSEMTYAQNMVDGMAWWSFLIRAGLFVCAPWVGLCHALDDGNDTDRKLGMTIDIEVLLRCDGIIATGHKMSRGMRRKWEMVDVDSRVNLIGLQRDGDAIKTVTLYEAFKEGLR